MLSFIVILAHQFTSDLSQKLIEGQWKVSHWLWWALNRAPIWQIAMALLAGSVNLQWFYGYLYYILGRGQNFYPNPFGSQHVWWELDLNSQSKIHLNWVSYWFKNQRRPNWEFVLSEFEAKSVEVSWEELAFWDFHNSKWWRHVWLWDCCSLVLTNAREKLSSDFCFEPES